MNATCFRSCPDVMQVLLDAQIRVVSRNLGDISRHSKCQLPSIDHPRMGRPKAIPAGSGAFARSPN
jgi:hypothetical protein